MLYAYALRRVRNATIAEDLVQETLLGALRSSAGFEGRSSERTWLIGILRHKLLDHWRQRGHADDAMKRILDAELASNFTEAGTWRRAPQVLPAGGSDRVELASILRRCLESLPPRLIEAFLLREKQNVDVEHVAEALGVTTGNAAQMLHRARLVLRSCLERRGRPERKD